MLKKILKKANLGFSLGILVGDGIAMLTGSLSAGELILVSDKLVSLTSGDVAYAFIIQSLLSGLYGALVFGTMIFYDIESWPLSIATAAHCLVTVGTFVPLSLLLGWSSGEPIGFLIMVGCQLVGFFIIWVIMYTIYKKQVKELNELQDKMLRAQKKA
ncbi:MAG: DUF3021 domain-containing protein [Eubacterium sp.]|nr:DUF3021 domain-containing protein [Eubacterium sp.]